MSNGSPDTSGHACADTFDEDDLRNLSGVDDTLPSLDFEDWFQDDISDPDGAMASCEAQSGISVGPPLGSDDIRLQSPFSTPVVDQQPFAEADLLAILYNSTTHDTTFGGTQYPQQFSDFSASDNVTPDHPNGDSVPEAPLAQSPSGQTTCLTCCGHTFGRSKDLKRHKSTVHREDNDPVYTCRCGKDDPRKDNHGRHVRVCVNPPCKEPPSLGSYVCKCSHSSQERDGHLEHVKSCSTGRRGRRRPNAS
ncbi:hypothetical protein G7054_g2776 [Neopestalotiopsis clavispora]|nr:hypothetical protein G7054_g2776 [Neopestalotiopsis clavispora]